MNLSPGLPRLAIPELSTLYRNIAHWPLAGRLMVGAVLALLALVAGMLCTWAARAMSCSVRRREK